MGRLVAVRGRLGALRGKVTAPVDRQERDRERDQRGWRGWYKTSRWQKLRWAVLVRDLFTCGMCQRIEGDTSQLVADHRRPHRGDADLFWDDRNLWTLCKRCHDSTKQRAERRESLLPTAKCHEEP